MQLEPAWEGNVPPTADASLQREAQAELVGDEEAGTTFLPLTSSAEQSGNYALALLAEGNARAEALAYLRQPVAVRFGKAVPWSPDSC